MDSQKKMGRFLAALAALLDAGLLALSIGGLISGQSKRFSILLLIFLLVFLLIQAVTYLLYKRALKNYDHFVEAAYSDPVTGGSSFTKFKLDAEQLFRKYPKENFVVFYSDIHNFKYINDVYGFEAGNQILRQYSHLLGEEKKLVYARLNADRFVSIERCGEDKLKLIKLCLDRIKRVSNVGGIIPDMPAVNISVGAYCTDGDNLSLSIDAMIDRARIAQKRLKNNHEAGCLLFAEAYRSDMLDEQDMENRMRAALENGEFIVYLQPKFDIKTNRATAAEALCRWNDPEHGLVTPIKFIPLFERNGFIRQLDTYMFEQVCMLLRKWLDEGGQVLPVSVNISRVQLNSPTFLKEYIRLKDYYRIPDGMIEVEFTESIMFSDNERMIEVLEYLRDNGVRSSIDDFGSGYSSLNLLKMLPTDILKLDKQFFDDQKYQDREKVIIKNVISMAKELSMQTVAEGVERWPQVDFLRAVQCELVQGYVYDRPLPIEEFERKYVKTRAAMDMSNA